MMKALVGTRVVGGSGGACMHGWKGQAVVVASVFIWHADD